MPRHERQAPTIVMSTAYRWTMTPSVTGTVTVSLHTPCKSWESRPNHHPDLHQKSCIWSRRTKVTRGFLNLWQSRIHSTHKRRRWSLQGHGLSGIHSPSRGLASLGHDERREIVFETIVCQDRVGPSPVSQTGFTEGLVDVSGESAKMAQMYVLISLKATLSSTAQGAPPYRTHLSHGMRRMTSLQARRYLGE